MSAKNEKTLISLRLSGFEFLFLRVSLNQSSINSMNDNYIIKFDERQSITVTSDHFKTATIVADFFLSDLWGGA